MIETGLFFLHSTALLLFGVCLSVAFSGVRLNRNNLLLSLGLCFLSGTAQIALYLFVGEDVVRRAYPLLAHLPIVLLLCLVFRKRIVTAMAAIGTAYLLCQPAKWIGVLVYTLSDSQSAAYAAQILILAAVAWFGLRRLTPTVAEIFSKDTRSVCIFGITPVFYYLFDYITVVYTDGLYSGNPVVLELLPFFLSVIFAVFCGVYYEMYEKNADALRREQVVRITVGEQKKELEAIRRSEKEIRVLRHDMRFLLGNISLCLENGDIDAAEKMIASYVESINKTVVQKYCENDTLNYILSDFAQRCRDNDIQTLWQIEPDPISCDEVLLSTILSNALDNAINAQLELPKEKRRILILLKQQKGKLLLSVKNPMSKPLRFADGLPLSDRKGHGYGAQSIRYLAERMGGNSQFTTEEGSFVLRVII